MFVREVLQVLKRVMALIGQGEHGGTKRSSHEYVGEIVLADVKLIAEKCL